MSGEIFGVDIAGIILDTFDGQLHDLTLRKKTQSDVDTYGVPVVGVLEYPAQGVRLAWDSKTAVARGYPIDAVKILLLQDGIPAPDLDDEIDADGECWRVLDVRKGPVNATWAVAGVKA